MIFKDGGGRTLGKTYTNMQDFHNFDHFYPKIRIKIIVVQLLMKRKTNQERKYKPHVKILPLELVINISDNLLKRICIIDSVAVSGSVHNC